MDATHTVAHLVSIPYPGRGHVNSMMNLCRRLASYDAALLITFVVTEEWLGLIGPVATAPPNLRFRSIPNVIPSEKGRAGDFAGFIESVYTKMEEPFEELLKQLQPSASCIVADTYLPWAVPVGRRQGLAVASLWPMSPMTFSILCSNDALKCKGHFSVRGFSGEKGEERVDYIPGISSIRLADLIYAPIARAEAVFGRALEAVSQATKSDFLLFTSVYELDSPVIDSLRAELPLPVYNVGPTIPYMTLQDMPLEAADGCDTDYFAWLNSQPRNSVLYVSLGSFLSVSGPQLEELAEGLQTSGVRFLWVARWDASNFKVSSEVGLVVPWCDQLKVLCHPSVGGFLTHCGWNSVMESMYAGVPMLTFPIFWDQIPNAKLVVEDWKVGLRVKRQIGEGVVVRRHEVTLAVTCLMDLEGAESKEIRERAAEMKGRCRRATDEGGSSVTSVRAFLNEIVRSSTIS